METDPICRMQVDKTTAAAMTEYGGRKYYFCCQSCKEKFEQDPERFVKALNPKISP